MFHPALSRAIETTKVVPDQGFFNLLNLYGEHIQVEESNRAWGESTRIGTSLAIIGLRLLYHVIVETLQAIDPTIQNAHISTRRVCLPLKKWLRTLFEDIDAKRRTQSSF